MGGQGTGGRASPAGVAAGPSSTRPPPRRAPTFSSPWRGAGASAVVSPASAARPPRRVQVKVGAATPVRAEAAAGAASAAAVAACPRTAAAANWVLEPARRWSTGPGAQTAADSAAAGAPRTDASAGAVAATTAGAGADLAPSTGAAEVARSSPPPPSIRAGRVGRRRATARSP